ncbi:MAG: signal recognition particle subunit SRP19/SEC65 family protein [Thermoplasmatota archaeon]
MAKGSEQFVLWPIYFDASVSRAAGRRVPHELAVRDPDAAWIETAARRLHLDPVMESDARHPHAPYLRCGRVLVTRKGPKQALLAQVAARMREAQARP